jgi:hypothetical protein
MNEETCDTIRFNGESEVHMAYEDDETWCDKAIPEDQRYR